MRHGFAAIEQAEERSAAIAEGVSIGPGTRVGPGAVIYAGCTIGANCSIGPGAVVGWVGLAYHRGKDGRRTLFPHLGGVRIGDWVDIGANSCLCRGMLSDTLIGDSAIGQGVIVGGGAVVTRTAAEGEKLVGVPARHAPKLRRFGPTPRDD